MCDYNNPLHWESILQFAKSSPTPSLLLSNGVSQGSFGTKHASPDGKRREKITFNQFLHCAKHCAESTIYGIEVKRPHLKS